MARKQLKDRLDFDTPPTKFSPPSRSPPSGSSSSVGGMTTSGTGTTGFIVEASPTTTTRSSPHSSSQSSPPSTERQHGSHPSGFHPYFSHHSPSARREDSEVMTEAQKQRLQAAFAAAAAAASSQQHREHDQEQRNRARQGIIISPISSPPSRNSPVSAPGPEPNHVNHVPNPYPQHHPHAIQHRHLNRHQLDGLRPSHYHHQHHPFGPYGSPAEASLGAALGPALSVPSPGFRPPHHHHHHHHHNGDASSLLSSPTNTILNSGSPNLTPPPPPPPALHPAGHAVHIRHHSTAGSTGSGVGGSSFIRNPMCGRCRNHNKRVSIKGHKRYCEYKNCRCSKCRLLDQRQLIQRQQIALRRAQEVEDARKSMAQYMSHADLNSSMLPSFMTTSQVQGHSQGAISRKPSIETRDSADDSESSISAVDHLGNKVPPVDFNGSDLSAAATGVAAQQGQDGGAIQNGDRLDPRLANGNTVTRGTTQSQSHHQNASSQVGHHYRSSTTHTSNATTANSSTSNTPPTGRGGGGSKAQKELLLSKALGRAYQTLAVRDFNHEDLQEERLYAELRYVYKLDSREVSLACLRAAKLGISLKDLSHEQAVKRLLSIHMSRARGVNLYACNEMPMVMAAMAMNGHQLAASGQRGDRVRSGRGGDEASMAGDSYDQNDQDDMKAMNGFGELDEDDDDEEEDEEEVEDASGVGGGKPEDSN